MYASQTYAHRKKLREANPELDARYRRQKRSAEFKKRYGITHDEYDQMLLEHGGVCALCSRECPTGRRLAVDHDHTTGRIRGLLCVPCNRALAQFGDNLMGAERLVNYLA
jgi:hypothetical protein